MTVHSYLLLLIAVIVAARIAWIGTFAVLSVAQPSVGESRWKRLRKDLRLPPALRGDTPEKISQVRDRYDLFKTQLTATYTLGGLAFTGWSVLLATGTNVDRFTLGLLAGAVLTALACPAVYRVANGELTRMGFETCLSVAAFLLVAAMLTLTRSIFPGSLSRVAVIAIPAALAARDLAEVHAQFALTTKLF
jgi:hypothetical protein